MMNHIPNIYREIIKIRAFEETILDLFGKNRLSGTTHTYIGEEATAVSLMKYVGDDDYVFSNHRCHGHYLAYGGSPRKLLAEIMSKESGLCKGRGGSQHIHYKNFFTNGVQGGIVPNALGVAFANKLSGINHNTVVFLGDGTLGQGVVYEAFNISSIYKIPILYVVEDNAYAMTTRSEFAVAGSIKQRVEGFGITTFEIKSTDVDELTKFFEKVFLYLNTYRNPVCAVIHNYRLGAHSKGDDLRDLEEINVNKKNDPVNIIRHRIGRNRADEIHKEYIDEFSRYADELELEPNAEVLSFKHQFEVCAKNSFLYSGHCRCVELLQRAFGEAFANNKNVIFYGEDIRDPYGGAFKATKGLSTEYPDRVLNMPISEACMVGMAVGMGIVGKIPVVEMMFGDFITLGFDQLLNHASKYAWVFQEDLKIPMIIRMPSGGKRGYGPTHSQSLEKFLIGIPQIRILALSPFHDPAVIYHTLFENIDEPTIVIENKKMYAERIESTADGKYKDFEVREYNSYGYSTLVLSIDFNVRPDAVLITYGGMVRETLNAAERLMIEDELTIYVVVLSQLSPLPVNDLRIVLKGNEKIAVVEEGTVTGGVGAEILAVCIENCLCRQMMRIATPDIPIPNGIVLEDQVVPNEDTIYLKIKEYADGK